MWHHDTHPSKASLMELFDNQNSRFKIQLSHSYMTRNKETDELRFYHAYKDNHAGLETLILINNRRDFTSFIETFQNLDVPESALKERPNSKLSIFPCPLCILSHLSNLLPNLPHSFATFLFVLLFYA